MAYQIPRPGDFVPAQKAQGPRLLDAAISQQQQANALRAGKENEKTNRLKAGVQLAGSAMGEGGWMEMFNGADDAGKVVATADEVAESAEMMNGIDAAEGAQGLEEGQMLADTGRGKALQMGVQGGGQGEASESEAKEMDALEGVATIASLASGNPMGLVGLAKLFKQYS
tara:strand:+ start:12147 stop:12656 length:510 start_codon:yes stop_codon:yes gene_type:complete